MATLKVTKHLNIADPRAVVRPAQMGAAIATQGAFRQQGRLEFGYALVDHRHSAFAIGRADRQSSV
jgi:hypothetical protein